MYPSRQGEGRGIPGVVGKPAVKEGGTGTAGGYGEAGGGAIGSRGAQFTKG